MEIKKQRINLAGNIYEGGIKSGCQGSIIVPDVKPDILKILQVDADAYLCDKAVEDGKVTLSGKVKVTVLYLPEEDSAKLCALYGSFDFCEVIKKSDFEQGMTLTAVCDVDRVTYKLINSRKVGIEAQVMINLQVASSKPVEFVADIEGDDACCLLQNVKISSPAHYMEHGFRLEENFSLPVGKPEIGELLKGSVMIFEKEYKAISDKVVVKGRGVANILYLGTEGEVEYYSGEMPFTEVVDIPDILEDAECDINFEVGEVSLRTEGGCIEVGCDVTCCVKSGCEQEVSAVSDCYFLDASEALEYEEFDNEEIVSKPDFSTVQKEIITRDSGMSDIAGVYSAVAKPYLETVNVNGGKIQAQGRTVIYVLYTTDNPSSPVCSMKSEVPFSYIIDGDCDGCDILLKAECEHVSTVICSADSVEVRCGIRISGKAVKKQKIRVISGAEKGECIPRECGILVYFTGKDDRVWDIAKRYRVQEDTVKCSLNGDEICPGMKLIIPVSK